MSKKRIRVQPNPCISDFVTAVQKFYNSRLISNLSILLVKENSPSTVSISISEGGPKELLFKNLISIYLFLN